ncbi:MAG: hypothetical protein ABSA14_06780 [Acidimicrobiales bacterium]
MNGYVEAGYIMVLGTLSSYGVVLVAREHAARRRVGTAAVEESIATSADAPVTDLTSPAPRDTPVVMPGELEQDAPGRAP